MKLALPVFIFWFLTILFLTRPALAAMQMTFSALPDKVEGDTPFEVTVNLIDAPKLKKYYLRAALFESGKTSYFGYTYNHFSHWQNQPSDHLNFLEITSNDQGSWSGQLKTKADLSSSYFKGGGEYQFKVGRYTEGGSLSWSDNEDSLIINYAAVATSPSPNPVASPSSGQAAVSPSPSPTPIPSPSSRSSPVVRITDIVLLDRETPEPILGASSSQNLTRPEVNRQLALMLVTVGAGLLLAVTFIIVRLWRKN